mmetsp:Transcript_1522/g.5214  ORF Transcript_1522/g.5214 Transcript_1522/m.5214 type:complete len:402 (+) Transcript_1522:60-1265(+)
MIRNHTTTYQTLLSTLHFPHPILSSSAASQELQDADFLAIKEEGLSDEMMPLVNHGSDDGGDEYDDDEWQDDALAEENPLMMPPHEAHNTTAAASNRVSSSMRKRHRNHSKRSKSYARHSASSMGNGGSAGATSNAANGLESQQFRQLWHHWLYQSSEVAQSLSQLASLHKSHLIHHIGKSNEMHLQEKADIEALTEECKDTLKQMQLFVKKLSNRNDSKMHENLTKKFLSEWMELATRFQGEQEDYLQKLDAMKKRRTELSMVTDQEDDMAEMQQIDDMMDKMYDRGFSDDQIETIVQNRRDVIRRDKELSQIVKSIVSLHELFSHLNTLVLEQGTMLDRIDFNLEQTHTSVASANRHLAVAERHDRAGRSLVCILLLIVAVCITGALFLLKIVTSLSSF